MITEDELAELVVLLTPIIRYILSPGEERYYSAWIDNPVGSFVNQMTVFFTNRKF
jgi:hypothetical protein